MDNLFTLNSTDESDGLPQAEAYVWILGTKYNSKKDIDEIRNDIKSRLWFTYRKGFVPIGGFGSSFTSDKGWGCMLRCGQMVLGQALVSLHLGRSWRWTPETKNSTYYKILKSFEDRRAAPYSIHQIALTGASEGKTVGEWFGPNTIAQVLKKLVVFDDWSALTIHVALDNALIVNDVIRQCRVESASTAEVDGDVPLKAPSQWKPLLLLIPLRLGLNEINPIYISGLKTSFQFPQSLGLIGGKPSHALYFIGYVGDEVIFLDPHTTQRYGSTDQTSDDYDPNIDTTYHCKTATKTNFRNGSFSSSLLGSSSSSGGAGPVRIDHNQSGYSLSGFNLTSSPPSFKRFVPQQYVNNLFTSSSTGNLIFSFEALFGLVIFLPFPPGHT
ncbi:unnamed protein product [Trichogramma brassicae]|uniref:Cysteine protease n=1 Tax=Trichogramma brassicae TaxID=86971 RepID=A0A6H5IRN2_9HYME|nr:unnamed protein product [Trichogramma brassicae]